MAKKPNAAEVKLAARGRWLEILAAAGIPTEILDGKHHPCPKAGCGGIDVGEADQSQSGKGYRHKIAAAIYRNQPRTITQRERGVGSMQETFDAALVAGACFTSFDNLRGKIESAGFESFMTEPVYFARIPYSSPMEIDTTKTVLMLMTNKGEFTRDMTNRSSIVRIRKRGDDYQYQKFPEGDLLDHVQSNQSRYLGAVFAVVREWHRQGKPRLENAPMILVDGQLLSAGLLRSYSMPIPL